MIKFQSLLSSSSGNSTFVTDDTTSILIDCGASIGYIEKCLSRLCLSGDRLFGIFLTHAHTDHIMSAGALSRKYNLPVFATEGTFSHGEKMIGRLNGENIRVVSPGDIIETDSFKIKVFSTSHDVPGSVSYTVKDFDSKFGIATDSGCITDEIIENLAGCNTVIVESNHDIERLKNGPYPYPLKRRILGDGGHLSNEACGKLCVELFKSGTRSFWLGHLSEQNNLPELAFSCVSNILKENGISVGIDVSLNVIPKLWIEG